jgi:hypothetical protein
MANSRSNIYPIQLQGAELNLNKFDAEIKQYRGFNKNNSPFVGGCLANVFTKEEQLEGANDNNTIITEDGTVYRVDTTGLYKNDTKLIDTEGKDFYDVVDLGLKFSEDVIFVYDEDTYIIRENNQLVYVSGNAKYNIVFSTPQAFKQVEAGIEKKVIGGQEYTFIIILGNYREFAEFFILKQNGDVFDFNISSGLLRFDQQKATAAFLKFSEESEGSIRFAVLAYITHISTYGLVYNFDGQNLTLIKELPIKFRSGTENLTYVARKVIYTKDYAYVAYGNIGCRELSSLKFGYSIDFSDDTTKGITLDVDAPVENITYWHSALHIHKSWGILGSSVGRITPTGTIPAKYKFFTLDDEVTTFGSPRGTSDVYSDFNIGGIINGCVLTNNKIVSGISLPGGWVLASEWNTVDVDYIFFGENTQTWKDNKFVCLWKNISTGRWYKLIKSTPKIKFINNQVVINSNTVFNSYDVLRNKTLLFAPAWNNRRLPIIQKDHTELVYSYFATSINEYTLENNASIIINPVVTGHIFSTGSEIADIETDSTVSINDKIIVNAFQTSSADSVDTKYFISALINNAGEINYTIIESERGLPFPTNTDGNIAYSPSLFAKQNGKYGNLIFISEYGTAYKLMTYNNKAVMSFYLSTAIEGLQNFFTIQGQLYGILNDEIYNFNITNEVANRGDFIVSVSNLQFVGNTPYEALFFSKTNRCLYSFTGANVLNQKQLVDKISEVRNYLYNPATQTIFLVTNIGVFFYSIFGQFLLEYTDVTKIFIQQNGIILSFNNGNYRFIKYYLDEGDTDFEKQRIKLETCFYGMNNEVVTINDCLYVRLFSEEHEEGNLEISATTLSLSGRMTEKTTFNIKASDWDAITHTIYLRYQPKEQRGLGISFSIDSPFKIASLSVGSQADAVLVDKISKKAITAPTVTSNNDEW